MMFFIIEVSYLTVIGLSAILPILISQLTNVYQSNKIDY